MLELEGFSIPNSMQGKSMIPILNNPEEKINDSILIEMDDDHNDEKTRTLITDDWRITIFRNYGELYNLKDDPDEMNNLWDNISFMEVKEELIFKLLRKCINNQQKPIIRDCGY
ncbi:MAG TPA: DUF4976 domain-containing protein [archaeon]|nr:DUF4976 domain-containing protein [archaeon]